MVMRAIVSMCIAALVTAIFPPAASTAATKSSAKRGEYQSAQVPERDLGSTTPREIEKPRYPIVIPPASEIRFLLRKQRARKSSGARQENQAKPVVPSVMLPPLGSTVRLGGDRCNRAIPTRQEFLNMLRANPADANQIMQRCAINLRSISPLPQLPVGRRQLPEDTRQRPVGTWGR